MTEKLTFCLYNIVHKFIVLLISVKTVKRGCPPVTLTLTPDQGCLNVSRQALYLRSYLLNNIGQSWL